VDWVTREDVRIGRIACTWLIRRFVDGEGAISYLPAAEIPAAIEGGAVPFHVKGVEFDHRDGRTPFEAMLDHYGLAQDPVLAFVARIVNGADTDNTLYDQPEGPGLRAISDGIRAMNPGDDDAVLAAGLPLLDAVHAYAKDRVTERSG
jgi:hypothetical protein